ncbi:hypothetical protein SAMN04488102_1206 [Alkalibacterium subtropicum]|uniref:Uncharacterized protein n=1 Tax=Alkalibacterium subtropicum TaxID=753702 RepID=A0A1I1LAW3_9LACT|nr:hypothetical protein [Alkalibacterium subtropicum]SFC70277.1 hypothetical protein SAMN04488102_1206 [Alkalibacterium subtropicum]
MSLVVLFSLNLLASGIYLFAEISFSKTVVGLAILLLVILFLYTSQKIRDLHNGNPYLKSRLIISGTSILLMITVFSQSTESILYKVILICITLSTEYYEIFFTKIN